MISNAPAKVTFFLLVMKNKNAFVFFGLNVKSQNNEILLDQNHYINNISKVLISPPRKSNSVILNENENKILQEKNRSIAMGLQTNKTGHKF